MVSCRGHQNMPLHDKVLPDETHCLVKTVSKSQEEEIRKTTASHLEVLLLNITQYFELTANAHNSSGQCSNPQNRIVFSMT